MDSIFIFGLMLVLFGPKKLPEIARQAGKLMNEFRRASSEFKMQMEDELRASEQSERQNKIDAETRAAIALTAATTATTASLPDGSTVQLAPDGTAEPVAPLPVAPLKYVEPNIMPPSVGETVSTSAVNPYRIDSPHENAGDENAGVSDMPVAPDAEPVRAEDSGRAEDFYAQREAELHPVPHDSASIATEKDPEPALTAKLPGTEMYPDTAPMAESEQAPTHHA